MSTIASEEQLILEMVGNGNSSSQAEPPLLLNTAQSNISKSASTAGAPADMTLSLGVLEAADYGNKFNGQSDADGVITASFQNTGTDLTLDLKGYDVDSRSEVEIFLNGTSFGFLRAGGDQALADYSISIAAADQVAGENLITFEQSLNDTFVWGVTDLLLREDVIADITLSPGVLEAGDFGNLFNGQSDADGVITAVFQSTGNDLTLDFKGFDLDIGSEVEVFLNGMSQGFLAAGVDAGLADYSINIAASDQVAGENVITFEQSKNPAFSWGVTDLLLSEILAADVLLSVGALESIEYGNKFNGQSDDDGVITVAFQNAGSDLTLDFKGFDVDSRKEVEVFLNGNSQGFLDRGVNNGLADYSLEIAAEDQVAGDNIITFEQSLNDTFVWGVTDLLLTQDTLPDPTLSLDVLETGEFGNRFNGQSDDDGVVSAFFESTGTDLTLDFKGFDIDNRSEVEVFLNGTSQGFLVRGANEGLADYSLAVTAENQIAGTNVVSFEQAQSVTYKWGVTDLLLSQGSNGSNVGIANPVDRGPVTPPDNEYTIAVTSGQSLAAGASHWPSRQTFTPNPFDEERALEAVYNGGGFVGLEPLRETRFETMDSSMIRHLINEYDQAGLVSPKFIHANTAVSGSSILGFLNGSNDVYATQAAGTSATGTGEHFSVLRSDGDYDHYIDEGTSSVFVETTKAVRSLLEEGLISGYTDAIDAAISAGYTVSDTFLFNWLQGQGSSSVGGQVYGYDYHLDLLMDSVETAIEGHLGRDIDLVSSISQNRGYGPKFVAFEQLDAVLQNDSAHLGILEYQYQASAPSNPGSDYTHLSNEGYYLAGAQVGMRFFDAIQGNENAPMLIDSIVRGGANEILINFTGVDGVLVDDPSIYDPANDFIPPSNFGFGIYENPFRPSTNYIITSASIVDADTVSLVFNQEPVDGLTLVLGRTRETLIDPAISGHGRDFGGTTLRGSDAVAVLAPDQGTLSEQFVYEYAPIQSYDLLFA